MSYKNLTPENFEYIEAVYNLDISHKEKMSILSDYFDNAPRTIRSWWQKMGLTKNDSSLPSQLKKARERFLDRDTDVLLISAAQNKTLSNESVIKAMEAYRDDLWAEKGLKAQIVILPCRYRNPTVLREFEKKRGEQWWDHRIQDYLFYNKLQFGDVIISGDSRVQPTASKPLNGYEAFASENHFVIGHSRIHFKTLPRFKGDPLRVMASTGYVTHKNYSDSRTGERGELHHSYGFVVVERSAEDKNVCYYPRNVKVKADGSFCDLNITYDSSEGISKVESVEGIVLGDIHHEYLDNDFWDKTKELIQEVNPERVVTHDVLDGATVNPHESKDFFIQKVKIREDRFDVEKEVDSSLDFLNDLSELTKEVLVVESNHDHFLDRWINNRTFQQDLHNSEAFLKYATVQQTVDLRDHGCIYGYLVDQGTNDNVRYIKGNESYRIASYQCGYHGDVGVNGARGSIQSFSRLNTKMIRGHQHSPSVVNGVTTVGVTCQLHQYYNSDGMSSWANAHSIIHNNGKNQLLVYNDDYKISNLL